MNQLIRVLFAGMSISFLGSLPLGTLNVAAMQIAITDGVHPAILFGLGMLTVEVVYVRISLVAMNWVQRQKTLLKVLDWLTVAIVLALALSSFYAAMQPKVEKNVILSSTINRFLLGMMMCAVNPVQIPFWFGWSTVLFSKKILLPKNSHYNIYIIGIGLGTFIGTLVFIFSGKLVSNSIRSNGDIVNWVIGGIFLITAILHTVKIFRHKSVDHQIEHPEEVTGQKNQP